MHRRKESVEEQKKKLANSANNIVTKSDVSISKWLQSIIGTHSGLGEACNMDVLVDAVYELAPTINWLHVMEDDGFSIPDQSTLNLMMSIYTRFWKEPLPLHAVCRSLWRNTEGQNCLIRFIDMCQSLQILFVVLDSSPLPFSVKLAAAASRKDHSIIEKWLSAKSDVYKGCFLEECVNFLKEIMRSTRMEQPEDGVMNIYWGSFPLFVEVCQSHTRELLPTQLLDEHSTVRFGTICNELKERVKKMTLKYLQHSSFDIIEDHIGMLLKDSKDLISEEKQNLSQRLEYLLGLDFQNFEEDFQNFEEEYGPFIARLKTLTKSNDATLKYLMDGLRYFLDGDALLCHVEGMINRNKAAAKRAGALSYVYHDCLRAPKDISWISSAVLRVEEYYKLLSGSHPVLAELEELEIEICDLNRRVTVPSEERIHNFHSDCQDLDTLAKLYEDIGILSKKLLLVTKAAEKLCHQSKWMRILVNEKSVKIARCQAAKQHLNEEIESSKVLQELLDLNIEVEGARKSLKEKMVEIPEVSDEGKRYERILVDNAMSWRTRLLNKRNILGEMRKQGLDMCAFVSTVVMRESLGKRRDAGYRQKYMPKQLLKLSEYHLQDIYKAFCAKNRRKGSEKLDVCMERMMETGVVTELTYDLCAGQMLCEGSEKLGVCMERERETGAVSELTDDLGAGEMFTRYHISKFEKMKPGQFQKAFDKLEAAKVLVATFEITKGYYSVGPEDVYDVTKESILETNAAGNKLTHAVVIVGYGVTPKGLPYYAYQNWYGPEWGKDGFGMVTCRSIKQLYSAEV